MLAVIAPNADNVPDMALVEPEIGEVSPVTTPLTAVNVRSPVPVAPLDRVPLQLPV